MEELIKILSEMHQDIEALKMWKYEQDTRLKEADEEAARTQAEFEKFINQRKSEEARRAADEAELKKMMI